MVVVEPDRYGRSYGGLAMAGMGIYEEGCGGGGSGDNRKLNGLMSFMKMVLGNEWWCNDDGGGGCQRRWWWWCEGRQCHTQADS